jgi:hypothetical protein
MLTIGVLLLGNPVRPYPSETMMRAGTWAAFATRKEVCGTVGGVNQGLHTFWCSVGRSCHRRDPPAQARAQPNAVATC